MNEGGGVTLKCNMSRDVPALENSDTNSKNLSSNKCVSVLVIANTNTY